MNSSPQSVAAAHEMEAHHSAIRAELRNLVVVPADRFWVALSFFKQHVRAHFFQEELWMAEMHYASAVVHQREHVRFFEILGLLETRLDRGGPDLRAVTELAGALEGWEAEHSQTHDRLLEEFLRSPPDEEPLQWSDALAVGIPQVDAEHREIFERANQFLEAVSRVRKEPEVQEVLDYLDGHVRSHFQHEEHQMAELGCPGLAEHREEHGAYARRLKALKHHFESEGASAAFLLSMDGLLKVWLLEHVGGADRCLGGRAAGREG